MSENFRVLVERNADAMLVLDGDGTIHLVNPAAEMLFHRTARQLIGDHFGYPIVPGAKVEIEIVRSGGQLVTAEMHLADIEWSGLRAYLATLRDVTERKQAQAALDSARLEQLEMKDRMLSQVSHELRTPLAAIQEFVSLVRDGVGGEINPEQDEFLEIAFRNAKQLGSLIDDLVEVARSQSGKLKVESAPVDIEMLVRESAEATCWAAKAAGVEFHAHVEPSIGLVLGDGTRTRQVISNLLENAIKFTSEGGSVALQAQPDPERPGYVRVSVADTGCGIQPAHLDSIFERTHQDPAANWRSRRGLGLGLYICRDLIQLQGGEIWVESEMDKGSVFHFTLPSFSLDKMVEPALVEAESLRTSYSLVRVQIVSPRTAHAIPPAVYKHAREVTEASLYEQVDVVLPSLGESEPIWVVVGTGEAGMLSFVKRLRRRLEQLSEVERQGYRVYVHGKVHRVTDAQQGKSVAEAIATEGNRIAAAIGLIPGTP